ncbi:MAG: hypothetical protein K2Y37_09410 [Pirellulales bacterium]|nr:hypothetical protein [Pirellulales bacterium]
MLIIPSAIIGDTLIAMHQGWSLKSGGTFAKLVWPVAILCGGCVLLCASATVRRLFARRARQFWLLSVATSLGLLLGEVVLGRLHPQPDFHCRPPGARYRYEPNSSVVPGVFGAATASINGLGLRGTDRPAGPGVYRILCVGGSTTECLFLDDAESWPALLMADLNRAGTGKYWVGAAAVSEMASADHLRFLRDSPRVAEVQCVLLLVGAGDFMRLALGMDTGGQTPPLWLDSNWLAHLREIWNVKLRAGIVVDRTGERYALLERNLPIAAGTLPIKDALDQYANRLRSIAQVARDRKLRLVLCTQPVMWDDYLTTLGNERLRFVRVYPSAPDWSFLAGDCRAIMDQFNARLVQVATETGVELVDPATQMNGIEVYFYDDFRLNERGCAEFASLLAEWFRGHPESSR